MSTVHRSRKAVTLVLTCLGTFMVLLDATIVASALPTIQNNFQGQLTDLQWVVDAYSLSFAALMLTAGTLGDRFGRKRLFLLGLILFVLGSAFCGFAPTLAWLIFARALQGVGAATIAPSSLSVLASAFPDPKGRAQAIGVWAGVSGLGIAAGPLAGGWLIHVSSWSAIFFVNLPIGVVTIILGAILLSESRNPNARRIDLAGQVLVTGMLVGLITALIEGPSQGWSSSLVLGLFLGSAICLVAFLVVEALVREPMLPLSLFRNPAFLVTNVASVVLGGAMVGALFFLIQYFQQVQGYSALDASLRAAPATLAIFVAAPLAGLITSRIGPLLPIVLGSLLVALTFFLQATALEPSTDYAAIWWHYPIFGAGCGLMLTALTSAVLAATPAERSGLGSSVMNTSRQVGSALGIAILGAYVLNQLPGNIASQLTQRGVPGPISIRIADKIAAAGAAGSQSAGQSKLPLSASVLHQAVNQAFVDAVHGAFFIVGAAMLVSAVLAVLFVRATPPANRKSAPAADQREVSEPGVLKEANR